MVGPAAAVLRRALEDLRRSGAFPSWRAPRVLWAGASFPCGPLRLIASVLTKAGPVFTEPA